VLGVAYLAHIPEAALDISNLAEDFGVAFHISFQFRKSGNRCLYDGSMCVRCALLLVACLLLCGCKQGPATRRYDFQGEVMALNPQEHTATIKHGKIGDWMGAMTMEYPIKNEADWKKLSVGAHIDAAVFVTDASYYVGDVRVTGAAPPPAP